MSVGKRSKLILRPRLRVLRNDEVALGPGKIDLLAMIAQTGSITDSARKLGMSYMRAWKLIKTMNHCFQEPVVQTDRGGARYGGAILSESGREILDLYRRMERNALKSTQREWRSLQSLLRST